MSKHTHTPGAWRTGRKVFRTVYADDKLIGVMDRPEDAALAAAAPDLLGIFEAAAPIIEGLRITDEQEPYRELSPSLRKAIVECSDLMRAHVRRLAEAEGRT